MKFLSKIVIVITLFFTSSSFAVDKKYHKDISPIISAFKDLNKRDISSLIVFPLKRKSPVPTIKSKEHLLSDDVVEVINH